jgi:hypothetical protein
MRDTLGGELCADGAHIDQAGSQETTDTETSFASGLR